MYAFRVSKENLGRFINKASEHDSLQGNKIERIIDHEDSFTVIISRQYSFPYIITNLEEIAPLER
jgi:hypothetical protein